MKKSIVLFAFAFTALFCASLVTSCGGKKAEQTGDRQTESDTTKHDMPMDSTMTAYACPMHPEITGKEGDKCSKCGMKLVAAKAEEHKH